VDDSIKISVYCYLLLYCPHQFVYECCPHNNSKFLGPLGEGTSPPGKAKARRTVRLNVTMEIMAKKLLGIPSLESDLRDKALNISSYTRIDGKVKILNLFMKKVVVELNCTIQYNTTSGLVSNGDNCLKRVDV